MTNETEMANFALTALSKGSLNSINDPGKAGQLCATNLKSAVRQVLTDNLYQACIVRETVYPNGTPLPGWLFRYDRPTDMVKRVNFMDSEGATVSEWSARGNSIFVNVSPLILEYVRYPTSIGDLPELVAQAAGFTLAFLVGPGLDVENDILSRVAVQKNQAVSAALLEDERESGPPEYPDLWGKPRYL